VIEPKRYRKRPVEVSALRWDPSSKEGVVAMLRFCSAAVLIPVSPTEYRLGIKTPEGYLEAEPGDYVVRGIMGEFYPVKPDIFEATYEDV
jgi:hypothetical protein